MIYQGKYLIWTDIYNKYQLFLTLKQLHFQKISNANLYVGSSPEIRRF